MFHLMRRLSRTAVVAGVGAAAASLLDPKLGAERRRAVAERLSSMRGAPAPPSTARDSHGGPAAPDIGGPHGPGLEGRIGNQWRPDVPEPSASHVLEDKIRSEVLGRSKFEPLDLLINDVDGIIEIRGEVADDEVRSDLVAAVRSVPKVRDVHDLTHRPGEPAPNKAAAGSVTRGGSRPR
jgi:hypothetical protein